MYFAHLAVFGHIFDVGTHVLRSNFIRKPVLFVLFYDISSQSELIQRHKTCEKHVKHYKAGQAEQDGGDDHLYGSLRRDKEERCRNVQHNYTYGGDDLEAPSGCSVQPSCECVYQRICRAHRYVKHGGGLVGKQNKAQHTAYSGGTYSGALAAFSVKHESEA